MKKYSPYLSIVIIILAFGAFSLFANDNKVEAKDISQVLHEARDEYGLFSYQIGKTDPVIWIVMDDRKSEEKLREYLVKNANQKELSNYTIKIEKQNLQVVQYERRLYLLERKIIIFLKEEHHISVDIQITKTNQPTIQITLPNNAVKSASQVTNIVQQYLSVNSEDDLIKDLNLTVEVNS